MTTLAYLECPTGIAGDMCLGALVDAGVPLAYLRDNLERLGIAPEYQLRAEPVQRNGQQATKVFVDLQRTPKAEHSHRHLPEIEQLIATAMLPSRVQTWSLEVFRQLAIAEGAVHGLPPEQVHFHEVGATDAMVDIVGTCLGFDFLDIDQIVCSPLPTGGGTVRAAHGPMPVPVPAVLKLWQMHQVPVYSNGIEQELVTPTGAAIAVTLATVFGPPPPMVLHKIGLGAGSHPLAIANILRLWIGESQEQRDDLPDQEAIVVLETQIDDLSPQAIGYTLAALLAAGALDVFTQAIGMKKSRPGVLLTVICPPPLATLCETILFRETTTLGVRRSLQQRRILQRQLQTVNTPYGAVQVKVAWQGDQIFNVQPEYDDCAQLAQAQGLPWQTIHRLALQTWYAQSADQSSYS